MLIIDTNVLSALMQDAPDARVADWLDRQAAGSVWTTTITIFEIRYGLDILPKSKKQQVLIARFENTVKNGLEGRILSFDNAAAEEAAAVMAKRRKTGLVVDARDTFIAGIALARRAQIATRNVRHFNDLGLKIVNPWTWRE